MRTARLSDLGLDGITPEHPVLIAGPTASGKSELALRIAQTQGGIIINADASQVYACWRVLSARPGDEDEARAPHALYGHVAYDTVYSAGQWLHDIATLLRQTKERPIIVGGTGLYFRALTEGLAEIPAIAPDIRARADALSLDALRDQLDPATAARLDLANRARVQRAWEVLQATDRGLSAWQDATPPPLLAPSKAQLIALHCEADWLNARINARFDAMIENGALQEVAAMSPYFNAALPSCKVIGAPELMQHLSGACTLQQAAIAATTATRQYAKRQRTWLKKRMRAWHCFDAQTLTKQHTQ